MFVAKRVHKSIAEQSIPFVVDIDRAVVRSAGWRDRIVVASAVAVPTAWTARAIGKNGQVFDGGPQGTHTQQKKKKNKRARNREAAEKISASESILLKVFDVRSRRIATANGLCIGLNF